MSAEDVVEFNARTEQFDGHGAIVGILSGVNHTLCSGAHLQTLSFDSATMARHWAAVESFERSLVNGVVSLIRPRRVNGQRRNLPLSVSWIVRFGVAHWCR
jgi:hypothetical protein